MIPVADLSSAEAVLEHARLVRERAKARNAAAVPAKAPKPAQAIVVEPEPAAPRKVVREIQIIANDAVEYLSVEVKAPVIDVAFLDDNACFAQIDRPPSLEFILRSTALTFGFSISEIVSPRRHGPLQQVRRAYAWLSKTLTTRSFPEIGQRLGGRDHTTIMHAVKKAEKARANDPEFKAITDALSEAITSSWANRAKGGVQ